MAGEIKFRGAGVASTAYARILGSGSAVWSNSGGTGGFGPYLAAAWEDYAISCTEQGATNVFVGNAPTNLPAGVYDVDARNQIGGSPAVTDPGVAQGDLQWNGVKTVPLSDLATSGQVGQIGPIRLARGTQIQNFPIYLKSAADHITPFTSGIVSGQIARDGGNLGVLQSGAITEIGQGYYNLQALTSGDLLANTAKLLFTAVGISGGTSDPLPLSFILQRVSGF